MLRSSIYVRCPGCRERTLVREVRGTYDCAACGFDYGELAKDTPRFEAFLVERMREGPTGQLGAIALHQWLSGLGVAESTKAFRAIADKHGVPLPAPMDPNDFLRRVGIGIGIVVATIVALVAYFVVTG